MDYILELKSLIHLLQHIQPYEFYFKDGTDTYICRGLKTETYVKAWDKIPYWSCDLMNNYLPVVIVTKVVESKKRYG